MYEQPPRPQDETLRYVYVHSIYTEPEYRRLGLARKLLTTIVDYCRDQNFKTLTLHAVEASKSLYESFGFKPTYLTDYEMANSSSFQDFGRNIIKNKTGEIGMHLHAWNTPPIKQLTKKKKSCLRS